MSEQSKIPVGDDDPAATPQEVVTTKPKAKGRTFFVWLRDVVLFLASPFIAVAYIALFPFIGLLLLVKPRRQA